MAEQRLYYITKADASVKERNRCKKWLVRVPVGTLESRDKNGKPFIRWKSKTIHGTYSEAEAYAQRHVEEYKRLNPASNPDIAACDYFDLINEKELAGATADMRIKAKNTYKKRRQMIKTARLTLKQKRLAKVTIEDLQAVLQAARAGITPSGYPYGDSSLGTLKDTLKHFMTAAYDEGLIASNPALYVKSPRVFTASEVSDGRVIDDDTLNVLESALNPSDDFQRGILVLLWFGLRPGELCALRWGDIDFKKSQIHIQHSLTNEGEIKLPKTDSGNRILPMTAEQADKLLYTIRENNLKQADYVILGENRKPFKPNNLAKRWRRVRDTYGLTDYTPKDFRHTFCTNLARAGCTPIEIKTLMGHKDERIALRVYQHIQSEQQKREAIERLNTFRQNTKK